MNTLCTVLFTVAAVQTTFVASTPDAFFGLKQRYAKLKARLSNAEAQAQQARQDRSPVEIPLPPSPREHFPKTELFQNDDFNLTECFAPESGTTYDSLTLADIFAITFRWTPDLTTLTPMPTTLPMTDAPTPVVTDAPTDAPTPIATDAPTDAPTPIATNAPTGAPTPIATNAPTDAPTPIATNAPTDTPTPIATSAPTDAPTPIVTNAPTDTPTPIATQTPTDAPTPIATQAPTDAPTPIATSAPTDAPTPIATNAPTDAPTPIVTNAPTDAPTPVATNAPTDAPTPIATNAPTDAPTPIATNAPTDAPTPIATQTPTDAPTPIATQTPTDAPTPIATNAPTDAPTPIATNAPTDAPTPIATNAPTDAPTPVATNAPTDAPTPIATNAPTNAPTPIATSAPTDAPTPIATNAPTDAPTPIATNAPTNAPTPIATNAPTSLPIENLLLSFEDGVHLHQVSELPLDALEVFRVASNASLHSDNPNDNHLAVLVDREDLTHVFVAFGNQSCDAKLDSLVVSVDIEVRLDNNTFALTITDIDDADVKASCTLELGDSDADVGEIDDAVLFGSEKFEAARGEVCDFRLEIDVGEEPTPAPGAGGEVPGENAASVVASATPLLVSLMVLATHSMA